MKNNVFCAGEFAELETGVGDKGYCWKVERNGRNRQSLWFERESVAMEVSYCTFNNVFCYLDVTI